MAVVVEGAGDESVDGSTRRKIARLTIIAKGKNFLTRIWELVTGRKSYSARLNWL